MYILLLIGWCISTFGHTEYTRKQAPMVNLSIDRGNFTINTSGAVFDANFHAENDLRNSLYGVLGMNIDF